MASPTEVHFLRAPLHGPYVLHASPLVCSGVTISGIELEVQLVPANTTDGKVPPVAKLMRRFSAGEYRVTPPRPSAIDAERDSRGSKEE